MLGPYRWSRISGWNTSTFLKWGVRIWDPFVWLNLGEHHGWICTRAVHGSVWGEVLTIISNEHDRNNSRVAYVCYSLTSLLSRATTLLHGVGCAIASLVDIGMGMLQCKASASSSELLVVLNLSIGLIYRRSLLKDLSEVSLHKSSRISLDLEVE